MHVANATVNTHLCAGEPADSRASSPVVISNAVSATPRFRQLMSKLKPGFHRKNLAFRSIGAALVHAHTHGVKFSPAFNIPLHSM